MAKLRRTQPSENLQPRESPFGALDTSVNEKVPEKCSGTTGPETPLGLGAGETGLAAFRGRFRFHGT
jgi:hypothetical protein